MTFLLTHCVPGFILAYSAPHPLTVDIDGLEFLCPLMERMYLKYICLEWVLVLEWPAEGSVDPQL